MHQHGSKYFARRPPYTPKIMIIDDVNFVVIDDDDVDFVVVDDDVFDVVIIVIDAAAAG